MVRRDSSGAAREEALGGDRRSSLLAPTAERSTELSARPARSGAVGHGPPGRGHGWAVACSQASGESVCLSTEGRLRWVMQLWAQEQAQQSSASPAGLLGALPGLPCARGAGDPGARDGPGGRAGRVSEGPAGDLTLQLGGQDRQPRALLPQAGPHQGGRAGGLGGRLRHGAGGGCCHGPRPPREQAAEGGRRGNSRAALAIPPGGPAPGPRPQGSPGAVISRGGHWGPGCGQEPGICRHLPGSAGSEWVTATSARGGGRGATPAGPRPARPPRARLSTEACDPVTPGGPPTGTGAQSTRPRPLPARAGLRGPRSGL